MTEPARPATGRDSDPVTDPAIRADDPRRPPVVAILERHLTFCLSQTPPERSFALDVEGLLDPAVTLYSYTAGGQVLGIGAIKELDPRHAELKSMHTAAEARGRGVGRAMLMHLLAVARSRGYRRVSLETGTTPGFAAARAMYARAGFEPAEPFGAYLRTEDNTFYTLDLGEPPAALPAGGLLGRHRQQLGRVSLAEFRVLQPRQHP